MHQIYKNIQATYKNIENEYKNVEIKDIVLDENKSL